MSSNQATVLDAFANAADSSLTTSHTSGTVATTGANDLLVTLWGNDQWNGTLTETSGFTIAAKNSGGANLWCYKIAGVAGNFSETMTSSPAMRQLSVLAAFKSAGGTTGNTVTYTAPATSGNHMIVATSVADSNQTGFSTVTVSSGVVVSINPSSASLAVGAPTSLTATVTGTSNTAVTWTVDGIPNGNAAVGTIAVQAGTPVVRQTYHTALAKIQTGVSVMAGDLICVGWIVGNSPGGSNTHCSDSSGNTYTEVGGTGSSGYSYSAAAGACIYQFYTIAGSSNPSLTVTISSLNTNSVDLFVGVVGGISSNQATVLDAFANAADSSLTSSHTSGTVATTGANDLLVTLWGNDQWNGTLTETSGFTIAAKNSGGANLWCYKIAGVAGNYSETMTSSPAMRQLSVLAAFKSAGGITGNTVTYTAPATGGNHTIVATSVADRNATGLATVTVSSGIGVSLNPTTASLAAGASTSLTATVIGATNTAVTWTVEGIANGNAAVGTITAQAGTPVNTVTYMAPATGGDFSVVATSVADTNQSASALMTVTVTELPVPVITLFEANPTFINLGSNATLTWSVQGATSLQINGQTVTGTSLEVAPSQTTTFTLVATNPAGTADASVDVTVNAPMPMITGFTATTDAPVVGDPVQLTATFVNGTGNIQPEVGDVLSGSSVTVNPGSMTIYTLTVTNSLGESAQQTIAITPMSRKGAFLPGPSMNHARAEHKSITLKDGRVVLAFGKSPIKTNGEPTIEVFDPGTGQFRDSSVQAPNGRQQFTGDLVASGEVVLWGGAWIGTSSSDPAYWLDLFDAEAGAYASSITNYTYANKVIKHATCLLFNGQILKTGGLTSSACVGTEAYGIELFDPLQAYADSRWTDWIVPSIHGVGRTAYPHFGHHSVLLPNGKALIGSIGSMDSEIFDPYLGVVSSFLPGGMTGVTQAIVLHSGKVLLFGTKDNQACMGILNMADDSFQMAIPDARGISPSQCLLLPNGQVFLPSYDKSFLYSPELNTLLYTGPMTVPNRGGFTASLLENSGKVLIAGGTSAETEFYDPQLPFILNPSSKLVSVGEAIHFTATLDGSTPTPVTWSATAGQISTLGDWTAPAAPGMYVVTATGSDGNKLMAMITVIKPQSGLPGVLTLDPMSVTLRPGGTIPFKASATSGLSISFSRDGGGEIVGEGRFQAGSEVGDFHVTAFLHGDPSKSITALVRIRADADRDMVVNPSSATLFQGQTVGLTATRITNGQPSGDNIVWYPEYYSDGREGILQDLGNGQALFTASAVTGVFKFLAVSNDFEGRSITATITVEDGRPAIDKFSAFPSQVVLGQSTLLTWAVRGATSYSLDAYSGIPVPSLQLGPEVTSTIVTPSVTTNYVLSASNSFGTSTASCNVPIYWGTVGVSLSPKSADVLAGQTAKFTALVTGPTTRVTWTCSGGAIASDGTFSAPNAGGTYTVTATSVDDPSKFDVATVNVHPGIRIGVNPCSIVLTPNSHSTFVAMVTGSEDKRVSWTVVEPGGGQIVDGGDGTASYVAPPVAGNYTLQVASLADPSQVATVPIGVALSGQVDISGVFVVPESGWGGSLALFPNNSMADHRPVYGYWGSDPANAFSGVLEGLVLSGTRVSGEPLRLVFQVNGDIFQGTWTSTTETASIFSGTRQANAVAVLIQPRTVTMGAGGYVAFTAKVVGTDNSVVNWNAGFGTINSKGQFLSSPYASVDSVSSVTATSSADPSKSATATVTIKDRPIGGTFLVSAFEFLPSSIPPGGKTTMAWTFVPADQVLIRDESSTDPPLEITGTNAGIGQMDLYPASSKYFNLIARNIWGSVSIERLIHVSSSTVDIAIAPKADTLYVGQSLSFSKTLLAPTQRVVWTCRLGSITQDGVYTAPHLPGTDTVTVTSVDDPNKSDSSQVTVQDISIHLGTSAVNLEPGASYQFTYSATIPSESSLLWTASGGTITQSGLYTAPQSKGVYSVGLACSLVPERKTLATVTVALPGNQILPKLASVAPGGTQRFQAIVISGSVVWSVKESGGGTITQDGVYSAPLSTGTYTVQALNGSLTATAKVIVSTARENPGGGGSTSVTSPTTGITLTLSPAELTITAGTYFPFQADVENTSNMGVLWKIDDPSPDATLDETGVFFACRPGMFNVTATSVADPTLVASASVVVVSSLNVSESPVSNLRGYSVTVLDDGKVLIAGGVPVAAPPSGSDLAYSGSSWLYDPATKAYTPTGNMLAPRCDHYAVKLQNGTVLIAGGYAIWADPWLGGTNTAHNGLPYGHQFPFAEVYDSASGTFQALPINNPGITIQTGTIDAPGRMISDHGCGGQATLLRDGRVWFTAGAFGWWSAIDRHLFAEGSESFDPQNKLFSAANYGLNLYAYHGLESLADGRVFILQGLLPWDRSMPGGPAYASQNAGIFNPLDNQTTPLEKLLKVSRFYCTLTRLASGKILIVGGATGIGTYNNAGDFSQNYYEFEDTATAEVFDPETSTTTSVGSLSQARRHHAAILLPTGKVMIIGGSHHVGIGQFLYPNKVELYDPDTQSFSTVDQLDYGLSEPKLALMPDGSVLVAGQVQAPMDPPPANSQFESQGMRMMAANSQLVAGSALLGRIDVPLFYITAAYPLNEVRTEQLRGGVPMLSRISIPLTDQAVGAGGSQALPIGKTDTERWFILRAWKPTRGFKITDITVELTVGGVRRQVLVKQARTGDGPTTSGVFHQVDADNLPANSVLGASDWAADWIRTIQQRADANEMTRGRLEFYAIKVNFADDTSWATIPYGVLTAGQNPVMPPGNLMSYDFQLFGAVGSNPKTKVHCQSYGSYQCVQTIGLWSIAQVFQNSWFGTWDNDKWCDYQTYDWIRSNSPLLGPVNDISLEHGHFTSDHAGHLDGKQIDMYHPGYRSYVNSDRPGSGTTFRDSHIFSDLRAARNGNAAAQTRLVNWITAARTNLESIFTALPVENGYRPRPVIYMATTASRVVIDPTSEDEIALRRRINDGFQIYRLLLMGQCNSYQLIDSSGNPVLDAQGNAIIGAGLDLGIGATDTDSFQPRFASMSDDSHTHHLHLYLNK